jgi:hypothetical protein
MRWQLNGSKKKDSKAEEVNYTYRIKPMFQAGNTKPLDDIYSAAGAIQATRFSKSLPTYKSFPLKGK